MAEKNLNGSGLNEVWVRAAQLVKKFTGEVNLTKGDLQTQVNKKISGTDDTKNNIVTFTSGDTANPTAFKDVAVLASNENHKSILEKISNMFNNVRYLYKNVGGIKGLSSSSAITNEGQYALDAREKNASVDGTLANEINKLNSNLINVTNRITAFSGEKWTNCPIGISMYHYEGSDTTEYNIPSPFVEILALRYANHRGIAFAVDWRVDQQHQLWTNVLHDTWKSWIQQ